MNLQEYFDKALQYEGFRKKVEQNLDVLDEVYEKPDLMSSDLLFFKNLPPLNVLAVGEDWCPDVVHTLPRWARLAEQVEGISFRILIKAEVPELIQQFLGPGHKERIPLFLFLDGEGNHIAHWSGRARVADQWIMARRNRRAYGDIPKAEMEQLGHDFRVMYRQTFRRENFQEIKDMLAVAFGIPFDSVEDLTSTP
ncbi:MAG: thioredoxin family protein [Acidobacteriota bacterium]